MFQFVFIHFQLTFSSFPIVVCTYISILKAALPHSHQATLQGQIAQLNHHGAIALHGELPVEDRVVLPVPRPTAALENIVDNTFK